SLLLIVQFRRLLNNFFFQAEDGIRDRNVTGVQTCALRISPQTIPRIRLLFRRNFPPPCTQPDRCHIARKFCRDFFIHILRQRCALWLFVLDLGPTRHFVTLVRECFWPVVEFFKVFIRNPSVSFMRRHRCSSASCTSSLDPRADLLAESATHSQPCVPRPHSGVSSSTAAMLLHTGHTPTCLAPRRGDNVLCR